MLNMIWTTCIQPAFLGSNIPLRNTEENNFHQYKKFCLHFPHNHLLQEKMKFREHSTEDIENTSFVPDNLDINLDWVCICFNRKKSLQKKGAMLLYEASNWSKLSVSIPYVSRTFGDMTTRQIRQAAFMKQNERDATPSMEDL